MKKLYLFTILAIIAITIFAFPTIASPEATGLILLGIGVTPIFSGSPIGLGQQPENYINQMIRSGKTGETINFGYGVGINVAGEVMTADETIAQPFVGIACASKDASDIENDRYLAQDPIGYLHTGILNVHCEEAAGETDTVRIRLENHAVDTTKLKGMFCKTADAGKTAVINGAKFRNTTTASGTISIFLPDSISLTND